MSIVSVDNISPIGSGTSVTVNSAATLVLNNANSTGVITATSFVGSGANLTSLPAANLTGTLPAISGANLTSLPSQVTINNASGNRVLTSDGGTTLNGEANLTFDGSTVGLNGDIGASNNAWIYSSSGGSGVRAGIAFYGTSQQLSFYTAGSGSSNERLRIDSSGHVMIGTTTEGFASYGDQFTIANSGHCGMTIRSGTSSYGTIYFSDGDDGSADEVRGFIDYNHTTNQMQLGTNAATRLRIDSNGYVTKPNHPSFHARFTNNVSATQNPLVYDSVHHNNGSHYKSSGTDQGKFVAPVSGVYLFYWTAIKTSSGTVTRLYINVDGSHIYSNMHLRLQEQGNYSNGSMQAIVNLNAGQKVHISLEVGSIHGNEYTHFGGYLIH